jgi:hypothetical protein
MFDSWYEICLIQNNIVKDTYVKWVRSCHTKTQTKQNTCTFNSNPWKHGGKLIWNIDICSVRYYGTFDTEFSPYYRLVTDSRVTPRVELLEWELLTRPGFHGNCVSQSFYFLWERKEAALIPLAHKYMTGHILWFGI